MIDASETRTGFHSQIGHLSHYYMLQTIINKSQAEVTDGRVVRADVSVT